MLFKSASAEKYVQSKYTTCPKSLLHLLKARVDPINIGICAILYSYRNLSRNKTFIFHLKTKMH